MAHHVSKADFEELVEKALEALPAGFAKYLAEVPIEIRARPTPADLQAVGLAPNALLLGLYRGHPRTQRSVMQSGTMPDVIYLFQESIELCCNSPAELAAQVRKTLLHEIGHHFGLNEEELTELGYG